MPKEMYKEKYKSSNSKGGQSYVSTGNFSKSPTYGEKDMPVRGTKHMGMSTYNSQNKYEREYYYGVGSSNKPTQYSNQ